MFETDNLDLIEEFIRAGYAATRLNVHSEGRHRFEASRNSLGPISIDRMHLGFDLDFVADPLGTIGLVVVESGLFPHVQVEGGQNSYGPGEVFFTAQPDRPYVGRAQWVRFSYAAVDPGLLDQVAATAPGRTEAPVRLTGYRPVSPAAGEHLLHTIAYLRDHVLTEPTVRDRSLIASTAPQLLAATVLHTFPNTALFEPTIEDRHDAHPDTLRRAIAFIDDHAHRDICVADIAAAAHVTIRALQYTFRRYRGTTPMGYLRQVRLGYAHRELLAADPTSGATVTQIAARWGFFHPGRFADYYRATYGHPPYRDLVHE